MSNDSRTRSARKGDVLHLVAEALAPYLAPHLRELLHQREASSQSIPEVATRRQLAPHPTVLLADALGLATARLRYATSASDGPRDKAYPFEVAELPTPGTLRDTRMGGGPEEFEGDASVRRNNEKLVAAWQVREDEQRRRSNRDHVVRLKIAAVGIVLPYAARLPGTIVHGWKWFTQYAGTGSFLTIQTPNALAWGTLLVISAVSTDAAVLGPAVAAVFLWLGYAHGTLDLASSSTAALAILFIPIYAVAIGCATAAVAAVVTACIRWTRGR